MFQLHQISQILEWERRLADEDAKRINYRSEPDYEPAAAQPLPQERRSIFARIFRPAQKPQPGIRGYGKDCCPGSQAG